LTPSGHFPPAPLQDFALAARMQIFGCASPEYPV
jgi:hypothetical protein